MNAKLRAWIARPDERAVFAKAKNNRLGPLHRGGALSFRTTPGNEGFEFRWAVYRSLQVGTRTPENLRPQFQTGAIFCFCRAC
jgi:hypothetical protein